MNIKKVKDVYNAQPFQPFVIYLADGREIPVYRRDYIMTTPSGRALGVSQPDDRFELVDFGLVVGLEVANCRKQSREWRKVDDPKNSNEARAMTIEQLKRLYEAQPFRPFVIHLADGRAVDVPHREFMWAAPSGRTIFVALPDESVDIIDLLLVTDVVVLPSANGSRKRRRGG